MVSKAAKTSFEAGPVDKVKTGDPNKIASNTPDNLFPDPTSQSGLGLSTLMKLTGSSGKLDLVKNLQSKLDSGSLNPVTMLNNVKKFGSDVGKNFTKGVGDLGAGMLGNALRSTGWIDDATAKNLFGNDGVMSLAEAKNIYKGVKVFVDDAESFIKDADFKSVSGISKMIGDITGTPGLVNVLNISTDLQMLKFVNDLATEWGIPKAADKLFNTLPDDESKIQFCIDMVPSAVTSGNLANILFALDKLGRHRILALYPNIIIDILKNYRYPAGLFNATTSETVSLLEVLNGINPDWYKYNRQGLDIYTMDLLEQASAPALDALSLDNTHRIAALYMKKNKLRTKTIMDIAATYYAAIFKM